MKYQIIKEWSDRQSKMLFYTYSFIGEVKICRGADETIEEAKNTLEESKASDSHWEEPKVVYEE